MKYPEGGGTVGAANMLYGASPQPEPAQQSQMDLDMMAKLLKASKGAGTGGAKGAPTAGSASGVGAAANSSVLPASAAPGGLSAGPNAAWMSQITGGGAPAASSAAPAASGGGFGSTLATAGPWAALAAVIIANESKQRGDGNRGNSTGEHVGDLLSGKVLERDLDRYLAHNSAGDFGRRVGMMGTPSGIVRNTKDLFKWGKGLF